eukprot:1793666-Prymnesium_polylepis.1
MKEPVAPQEQDGQRRGETEEEDTSPEKQEDTSPEKQEDTSPEKQESKDEEVDLDLLDFGGTSDDEEDNILSEILRN